MARRWKIFLAVATGTLLADQLTKYWARHSLPTDGRGLGLPVRVIKNFWEWRLSYNTGSAFGLFHKVTGAAVFLTLIGIAAIGAILWMVRQAREDQPRLVAALGLVAGGALGNVLDRLLFSKVTDFVVWKYYQHEWPTFNVADAALCVGVALLFLDLGRDKERDQKAEKPAKKEPQRGR